MPPLLTLPAVDGVEITTIMDNSLDLIMSSTTVAHRFPLPHYGFTRPQLRAEHGVSLLITVIDQGRRETILFDTGVTPDGALHNLAVLGIDLTTIQAIVLSHGQNELTKVFGNPGSTNGSGSPPPEQFEPLTVPSRERLGSNRNQSLFPIKQSCR